MKWMKQNGTDIETNDMKETIAYCESLGWSKRGEKLVDDNTEVDVGLGKPSGPIIEQLKPNKKVKAGKI